jgi:hypothetical protein
MSDPMLKKVNIAIIFVVFERSLAFEKRSLGGFPDHRSAAKRVHLPALASGVSLSLDCGGVEPGFVGMKGDPLDRRTWQGAEARDSSHGSGSPGNHDGLLIRHPKRREGSPQVTRLLSALANLDGRPTGT